MNLPLIEHDTETSLFFFAISATLAGFYSYYFISQSETIRRWFSNNFTHENYWLRWVLFQKFIGFLLMGLTPGIIYLLVFQGQASDFGMSLEHAFTNWYWLICIPLLLVVINSFLAHGKNLQQQHPQMKLKNWTRTIFALSAFGWIIYLFAYEYLFRGLLLFSSYETFGYFPAIAINVALYSAFHLPKGIGETLGSIPFGILLCIITLGTGTILIAVFAHIGLAVSMEYFAIKYNPEISFLKIRKGTK